MRGDGRVYKRGNRFWIEYWVRGKQFRESVGRTEAEAKRRLKQRRREIAGDSFVGPAAERITVDELLDNYVAHLTLKGVRSIASVESQLVPVREQFKWTRAIDLSTPMIEAYMKSRLEDGKQPATVNRGVQALRAAFRLAQKQGRILRSPYFALLREDNVRQGFFEKGDFSNVAAKLPEPLADFAWWAFFTGWRKGEITSLRWEHVDRSGRELRLPRSKNGEGRAIPLAGPLWELIEKRWRSREYEVADGVTRISDYVFHRKGRPLLSFYKSWTSACRKAGLPGRRFHDLRRTGVRNLTRAGVSESVAMSITGHKTTSMFRRYNITDQRDKVEAIKKIEAHFDSQPESPSVVPIERGR